MNESWTPGPWQYIAGTEHHGPYVTSDFGNTICDCYGMTRPDLPATINGGPSRPVPFLGEMADPNARLIAAAPELYSGCSAMVGLVQLLLNRDDLTPELRAVLQPDNHRIAQAIAALAKAEGREP